MLYHNCSVPGGPRRSDANTQREPVHAGYTPVRGIYPVNTRRLTNAD